MTSSRFRKAPERSRSPFNFEYSHNETELDSFGPVDLDSASDVMYEARDSAIYPAEMPLRNIPESLWTFDTSVDEKTRSSRALSVEKDRRFSKSPMLYIKGQTKPEYNIDTQPSRPGRDAISPRVRLDIRTSPVPYARESRHSPAQYRRRSLSGPSADIRPRGDFRSTGGGQRSVARSHQIRISEEHEGSEAPIGADYVTRSCKSDLDMLMSFEDEYVNVEVDGFSTPKAVFSEKSTTVRDTYDVMDIAPAIPRTRRLSKSIDAATPLYTAPLSASAAENSFGLWHSWKSHGSSRSRNLFTSQYPSPSPINERNRRASIAVPQITMRRKPESPVTPDRSSSTERSPTESSLRSLRLHSQSKQHRRSPARAKNRRHSVIGVTRRGHGEASRDIHHFVHRQLRGRPSSRPSPWEMDTSQLKTQTISPPQLVLEEFDHDTRRRTRRGSLLGRGEVKSHSNWLISSEGELSVTSVELASTSPIKESEKSNPQSISGPYKLKKADSLPREGPSGKLDSFRVMS